MTITDTEPLYRKVGRKYVPAYSLSEWSYDKDMMPVGSFRLVHAYSDGGRRYAYEVTPDTAGWVAAATLAVHAMTEAIHKANQLTIAAVRRGRKNSKPLLRKRTPFWKPLASGAGADGRQQRRTTLPKLALMRSGNGRTNQRTRNDDTTTRGAATSGTS
jgi:hypothetical protein